jgi:hypothetical protein
MGAKVSGRHGASRAARDERRRTRAMSGRRRSSIKGSSNRGAAGRERHEPPSLDRVSGAPQWLLWAVQATDGSCQGLSDTCPQVGSYRRVVARVSDSCRLSTYAAFSRT